MYIASRSELFSTLPDPGMPWGRFAFSYVTHFGVAFALLVIGLIHPLGLDQPVRDYHFIRLVETPPIEPRQTAPVRFQPARAELVETPALVLRPSEEPKQAVAKPKAVAAPKVEIATTEPLNLPASAVSLPRQLVKTDVFSGGSSAVPTLSRAPHQVQTGGFGDPNGIAANENKNRAVNIAQSGSFDLPVGPGNGNGTGGKSGVKGVVASAGFGSGTAIADVRHASGASVNQGSFGDIQPASLKQIHNPPPANAATIPAEVIFKPIPVYTEEARKLRIEGEVLVEVRFESSGQIQILRVVRGLGHGLDESAVKAAEKIRFKPAQRNGEPTDTTAVLHILFQLA